jgi:hypothetical protein
MGYSGLNYRKLLVLTTSLMLMFLLCWGSSSIPLSYGLGQNEISLSFSWSKSVYYQGDPGSVVISLTSTSGDELEFTWVGLHYAWMQQDHYYVLDLSSSPVRIPSGGSATFSTLSFDIPSDAPVGSNDYYVRITFNEHHWYGWDNGATWTSSTFQTYIHDAFEKTFNDLNLQVSNKIGDAQNANYKSPDAESLLSQAQNEYSLAASLANQGKWQDAVSHLNTASNLLSQAPAKEQAYQNQNGQQLILIIAGISAIIIVLIAALVMLRRQRHIPKQVPTA